MWETVSSTNIVSGSSGIGLRHDDDALRLCPRDPQGNEEDDADDDEEDDARVTDVDSIPDVSQRGSNVSVGAEGHRLLPDVSYVEPISAESQRGSDVSADAEGQRLLPDVSYTHMSGSSRESGLANGTTDGCDAMKATPTTVPQSLAPTIVVTQTQEGEERDGGEATTTARPQRGAAQQQRALLGRLIQDDLL